MLLNFDLWHEIISHFECPGDERTLCSLALTSHSISTLALDTLWRSEGTIQAIVSVINSFSPSSNEPFLYRMNDHEDDTEGNDSYDEEESSSGRMISSWVLNKPIPPAACERALGYLARIRSLEVCQIGSPDELLWSILSTCLDSRRPLLPNLESLYVDFSIYDHNQSLIPLLSPSLKNLLINFKRPPKLDAILTFLNLAKVRGCDLEDFTSYGGFTRDIPETITLFKNLQNVYFHPNYVSRLKASITIVQFLTSLPSLRSLACSIETFSPSTDEDRFCHTNLKEIMIKSGPTALRKLFHICAFPSVTDMILLSNEIPNMEGIETSCPNARKLDLFVDTIKTPSDINRLSSLLPLPTLSFVLLIQKHTLTTPELCSFAESWPNIRFLKIIPDPTGFDPLSPLVFSNQPYLNYLNISLPFFRPLDGISNDWHLRATDVAPRGSMSSLRSLSLYYDGSKYLIMIVADRCTLVEHLLRLFPRLEELHVIRGVPPEENLIQLREVLVELGKFERDGLYPA